MEYLEIRDGQKRVPNKRVLSGGRLRSLANLPRLDISSQPGRTVVTNT